MDFIAPRYVDKVKAGKRSGINVDPKAINEPETVKRKAEILNQR